MYENASRVSNIADFLTFALESSFNSKRTYFSTIREVSNQKKLVKKLYELVYLLNEDTNLLDGVFPVFPYVFKTYKFSIKLTLDTSFTLNNLQRYKNLGVNCYYAENCDTDKVKEFVIALVDDVETLLPIYEVVKSSERKNNYGILNISISSYDYKDIKYLQNVLKEFYKTLDEYCYRSEEFLGIKSSKWSDIGFDNLKEFVEFKNTLEVLFNLKETVSFSELLYI